MKKANPNSIQLANRGLRMKEINYWDRFLMTGSIYDFLSYKRAQKDAKDVEADGFDGKEESGGHSHAGIYRDYGDGFKS